LAPVPEKPVIYGETLDSLTARLQERGEPAFRAKQILDWVYKKRARSWDEMLNLGKPLRAWLADTFDLSRCDYIVDAVDTVSAKVELAVRASQAGV